MAQSPAPLAGGGACGGVAFESQHRPADALDPVQSCLIHRSAACHTVLWKLLPAASNLSRSRADTCVRPLSFLLTNRSRIVGPKSWTAV